MRYLLIIIFITLLAELANGQQYQFRHYGVDDGLPSSEVYHVYQDSEGYIWIATDMGVSKFDGYEFKNYDLEDGLTDNTIFEIYEDYKGRIWFLSYSMRLSYYYNDTIHAYKHNDVISNHFIKDKVMQKLSFYVDEQDNIYFGAQSNSVIRIDSTGKLDEIVKDVGNTLHLFRRNSKYFHIWKKEAYEKLKIFTEDTSRTFELDLKAETKNLFQFVCKSENSLFLTIGNTLYHIREDSIVDKREFDKRILWMNLDRNDDLWLGLASGALRLNKNNIHKNENVLFDDQDITSVLKDHEGGYWFSTLKNGLYYVPSLSIKTLTQKKGLYSNKIGVITSDQNKNVWVGHKAPAITLIKNKEIFKKIELPKSEPEGINDIIFGPDNFAYIVRWNNFYRINLDNKKIQPKNYKHSIHASSLVFLPDDKTVISSIHGIKMVKNDEVVYKSCKEDDFCHRTTKLYYSEEDSVLYLGGLNGLWQYKAREFRHLGEENDLLYYRVVDITKFKDYLALATRGGGLILYNRDAVFQVTKKDGLLTNSINSIQVKNNEIWMAQNRGISKLTYHDVESELFDIQNITKRDGLANPEVNDLSIVDSIVYAGTNDGLSYFNFMKLTKNVFPPPIKIKNIKINDIDTTIQSTYKLDHNQNSFTISFVGLSFRQAGQIQYRYKMKGVDDSWNKTSRNRKTYTTLSPGDYEFAVQAQNEDGLWSEKSARIHFTIDPPFWKKWWFMGSLGLVIAILLWWLISFRFTMIKRRNELMNDINEYKQKILRQQMNPHFIFNTLNSIQYFLLDEDTTSSLNYLTKFARMMRIVLDNSQQTFVSIEDEIRGLNLYLELEALRFEESFDYRIEVDDDINTYEYKIPALILQPYVENSIRHGLLHKKNKGFLKVHIQKTDDSLLCSIEDDGVGRKKAEEIKMNKGPMKESLGSKITEDRINVLNSLYSDEIDVQYIDLEDYEGNPRGTRVEITLPFVF
ncbi:MAG: histidine kinase [Bacteroidota bacterium]